MKHLKVVSLFSGCGGFDLGATSWEGLDIIWANDIDVSAAQAYLRQLRGGH